MAQKPVGIEQVGAATLVPTTDPRYVNHGTHALRVSAHGDGDGVETIPVPYEPTEELPYISFFIAIAVEEGAARAELEDIDGVIYPINETLASDEETLIGMGLEGELVPEGDLILRVVAHEEAAVFYIDAMTLTRSAAAIPYSARMGPKALWKAAARYLLREGGVRPDHFAGSFLDVDAAYNGSPEITLGDVVTVQEEGEEAFEARVRVLEEDHFSKITRIHFSEKKDRVKELLLDQNPYLGSEVYVRGVGEMGSELSSITGPSFSQILEPTETTGGAFEQQIIQGVAEVAEGTTRVTVDVGIERLLGPQTVQITPLEEVTQEWWVEEHGFDVFDIVLAGAATEGWRFAWRVVPDEQMPPYWESLTDTEIVYE